MRRVRTSKDHLCAKKTDFSDTQKRAFLGLFLKASENGSEKTGHFLPTFFDDFFKDFWKILKNLVSAQKKWAFGQKNLKSGQAETVAAQGFAGFLPIFPLFLYTIMRKIVKIYIKLKTKVGFWPEPFFWENFGKKKLQDLIRPLSFFSMVWYTWFATHIVRSLPNFGRA